PPPLAGAVARRSAPLRLDGRLRTAAWTPAGEPPRAADLSAPRCQARGEACSSGRQAFGGAATLRPSRTPARAGCAAPAGPGAHRAGREEAGREGTGGASPAGPRLRPRDPRARSLARADGREVRREQADAGGAQAHREAACRRGAGRARAGAGELLP